MNGMNYLTGGHDYIIQCNEDYPGDDITSGTADSLRACIADCESYNAVFSDPTCDGVSFDSSTDMCTLKSFNATGMYVVLTAISSYTVDSAIRMPNMDTSSAPSSASVLSTTSTSFVTAVMSASVTSMAVMSSAVPPYANSTSSMLASSAVPPYANSTSEGASMTPTNSTSMPSSTGVTVMPTDITCPRDNGTDFTALENGVRYDYLTLCDMNILGAMDIGVFRQSFADCVATCTDADNGFSTTACTGISFNMNMTNGTNCFLKMTPDYSSENATGYMSAALLVRAFNSTAMNATRTRFSRDGASSVIARQSPLVTSPPLYNRAVDTNSSSASNFTTAYTFATTWYSASGSSWFTEFSRTTTSIVQSSETSVVIIEGGRSGGSSYASGANSTGGDAGGGALGGGMYSNGTSGTGGSLTNGTDSGAGGLSGGNGSLANNTSMLSSGTDAGRVGEQTPAPYLNTTSITATSTITAPFANNTAPAATGAVNTTMPLNSSATSYPWLPSSIPYYQPLSSSLPVLSNDTAPTGDRNGSASPPTTAPGIVVNATATPTPTAPYQNTTTTCVETTSTPSAMNITSLLSNGTTTTTSIPPNFTDNPRNGTAAPNSTIVTPPYGNTTALPISNSTIVSPPFVNTTSVPVSSTAPPLSPPYYPFNITDNPRSGADVPSATNPPYLNSTSTPTLDNMTGSISPPFPTSNSSKSWRCSCVVLRGAS